MKEAKHVTAPLMDVQTEEISVASAYPIPAAREEDQQHLNDLEDDFNAVVRFFAEGNDRDHTEDESLVWKRLTTVVS